MSNEDLFDKYNISGNTIEEILEIKDGEKSLKLNNPNSQKYYIMEILVKSKDNKVKNNKNKCNNGKLNSIKAKVKIIKDISYIFNNSKQAKIQIAIATKDLTQEIILKDIMDEIIEILN